MRVLLQRVTQASVAVAGETIATIGPGLLLLVGFGSSDSAADLPWMVGKVLRLRVFDDAAGVMNRSVEECGGAILAVSQFTLFGNTRKGNRPSWSGAARPEVAQPLFDEFVRQLQQACGRPVATGRFGANMQVQLINDGPVTLWLDSQAPE